MEKENSNRTKPFPVAFWLAENLVITNCNTPIESICLAAQKNSGVVCTKNEFNPTFVSKLVTKMFPNVHKSQVRSGNAGKRTISLQNIAIEYSPCNKNVELSKIPEMAPHDWFIFKKETSFITFGHTFDVTFNGQNSVLYLTLNARNEVMVKIDNSHIDNSAIYIPDTTEYTLKSIPALFRCMKILTPCLCYEMKSQQSFATSSKCRKELRCVDNMSTYVLRHKNCIRFSPITAATSLPICKICAQFIRNKMSFEKLKAEKENAMHEDLSKEKIMEVLKTLAPNLHEHQLTLIQSQILVSNMNSKHGVRWDKDIICMSLSLYNRNPGSYRDLTINGWLKLPSEQLLKVYKNAVKQQPGIVPDMMLWMFNEAKRQILNANGYYGGIILDEMAIQEDLQIIHDKSGSRFFGLSDSGENVSRIQALNSNKFECKLANHVQQYVFNGLSGFRWPFAHFPNLQAPPSEIFLTTWSCIDELYKWGFKPIYCCMDGSSNNRAFLKMHFPGGNPIRSGMVAKCYKNPCKKIIFLMDPCHLIKKIRNSVLSSGFLDSHQRLLTVNGHVIIWKMWIDAYHWDRSVNSFQIHHKLCDDHIFPNNAQKMRNKLAFDTLDSEMLNLMKCYSETLNQAGQAEMEGVIQFLQYTSVIVTLFTDSRPIKDMFDTRLKGLSEAYNWFKSWENEHSSSNETNKRHKALLTMETREDLDFMYHGFMSLVRFCIYEIKTEVVPCRINSDIIENIFCQERSLYHGANTNPNYNEYRTGINSIILGQSTTSRKSNAGSQTAKPFALGLPPKRLKLR